MSAPASICASIGNATPSSFVGTRSRASRSRSAAARRSRLAGSRAGVMAMSCVFNGYPCAMAATAPITMKRTSCFLSTRRISPHWYSGNGLAADLGGYPFPGDRVSHALGGRHVQKPIDVVVVRVVVVGEAEGQLETAGTDQLAERFQAGLDSPALPARDRRLRAADGCGELGLSQPRPQPGFAEKVCAGHACSITKTYYS